jgi:hypothetical protein
LVAAFFAPCTDGEEAGNNKDGPYDFFHARSPGRSSSDPIGLPAWREEPVCAQRRQERQQPLVDCFGRLQPYCICRDPSDTILHPETALAPIAASFAMDHVPHIGTAGARMNQIFQFTKFPRLPINEGSTGHVTS